MDYIRKKISGCVSRGLAKHVHEIARSRAKYFFFFKQNFHQLNIVRLY